ncbi:MAG: phosphoenolpyruvate synthase regulatory protein [Acidiferrobacteraceae bacterium]|nr:phosphoenolpyruvate synthase regulatory protein [Acidiferrobacteraceae bacterium]|tara:strand:+ start:124 stop:948 length:825 start_codon:yes stop_codon:yes gene_type:complete
MTNRSVFIVSDGTGITAGILGHSLLSQFPDATSEPITLPFIDSDDKAKDAIRQINDAAEKDGATPIVFSTFVENEFTDQIRESHALVLDLFGSFLDLLSTELAMEPSHKVGYGHGVVDADLYTSRIRAVHYSMDCDDGLNTNDYRRADVILVGVSRIGKTPVSMYLAMHSGLFCANYPLTGDELQNEHFPVVLQSHTSQIIGLTIDPVRLHDIRQERRPGSFYADLKQCRFEVESAEGLFRRFGIPFFSTTGVSIEEIATAILQRTGIRRNLLA